MAKLVETTYGEALFELAVQESKVDELCEEAQAVIDIFKDNEDLVNVLKSPKVEKKEKEQLIENIFKKFVSEDITGLLVIMVSKDRQTKIVSTLEYFIKRIYEYKKIGVAYVTLRELEKLLAVILQKEQVVGIDICGECSTTLNLFEEKRETVMDSQANKELLRFIRSSSGLQ